MHYITLIFIALACLSPRHSIAQDDVKILKQKVTKLEREIGKLKEQLEIAEHNGFYWPGQKSVGSPLTLLKDLPKDLKLKRNESWGKFQLSDVNEHLSHSKGQQFAARLSVKLSYKESSQRDIFDVSVAIAETGFTHNGHAFKTRYHGPSSPLKYKCGLDTVTKLKKINTRKPIAVLGRISSIGVNGKYINIRIDDLNLSRTPLP